MVPSTISSIPTTAAATPVSTITAATIQTVVKIVDTTPNAAFSAAVTSVTANVQPSPQVVSSLVPSRLLAHVARMYLEQARKRGVFIRNPAHMVHLIQGMVGIAVVGGGLTYLNRKVKQMMGKVPAGEKPKDWKERLSFAYKFLKGTIAANDEIRRDIVTAHDDLMKAQKEQREMLENKLVESRGKEEELEERAAAFESYGDALAFDVQNAKFDIEALQEQLKHAQVENEELHKKSGQVENEKSELAEKLRLYMEEPLQEHRKKMVERSEGLEQQLENARKENENSLTRLEEAALEIQNLRNQNDKLVQASHNDAAALSDKLEDERKRANGLEQSLAQKVEDLVQKDEVLQEAQGLVDDLQKRLHDSEELLQHANDNGTTQDEIIEELEKDIREAKADVAQIQQRFDEKEEVLQRKLIEKDGELRQIHDDADDLQLRLKKQDQDLQKAIASAYDLKQCLEKRDKDLEVLQDVELDLSAKVQQALEMEKRYLANYAIDEKEHQEEVDGLTQELDKTKEQLREETQVRQTTEWKLREEIRRREAVEEELRSLKAQQSRNCSEQDTSPSISSSAVRETNARGASTTTGTDTSPQEGNERVQYKTPSPVTVFHPVKTSATPSPSGEETPSRKRIRSEKPEDEENARPIKRQSTLSRSSSSSVSREVKGDEAETASVKSEHKLELDAFKNMPDFAPTRISALSTALPESPSPTRRSTRNVVGYQSLNERALAQRSMSQSGEELPSAFKSSARRRVPPTQLPKPAVSRQTRSQSPKKGEGPKSPKKR
jgi:hypothetical protein